MLDMFFTICQTIIQGLSDGLNLLYSSISSIPESVGSILGILSGTGLLIFLGFRIANTINFLG